MFTIHVIDNGLVKIAGHHYHHALGMHAGVKELGLTVKLYCMDVPTLPAQIKMIAQPSFEKFLYRPNPHLDIELNAKLFCTELVRLRPHFGPRDVLFFSNANYDEIAAIPKFIEQTAYQGRIILRLMFYPHGDQQAYFELLNGVLKNKNVEVVVSSLPYSDWLTQNKIPNRYIPGMPHILPYELIAKTPELYDFAYLGQAATVKGFDHFINALLICAKNNIFPRALIHAQGVNLPAHIQESLAHCTFIDQEISDQQFYADLMATRCMVTFYDVNNYRFSDSGIVTESIAFNKHLITSPLAFIEPTFGKDFAKVVSVTEWNAQALAKRMAELMQDRAKSDVELLASLQAKMLCSPTLFMKNALNS